MLAYPIFVFLLNALGLLRELPQVSELQYLITGCSWIINGICILVLYMCFGRPDFQRLFKLIMVCTIILGIESLVMYYLLFLLLKSPYALPSISSEFRFGGFLVKSAGLTGNLGLILIAISVYFDSISSKRLLYKAGMLLGGLIVFSAQLRSGIFALILIVACLAYLFLLNKKKRIRFPILIRSLLSVLLIVTMLMGTMNLRGGKWADLANPNSLFVRLAMWARALDIGIESFPFGVGPGMAHFHTEYANRRSILFSCLIDFFPEGRDVMLQSESRFFSNSQEGMLTSLHSSHIEFIVEYGLLGLIVVFLLFFYPLKILHITSKTKKRLGYIPENEGLSRMAICMFWLQFSLLMLSVGAYFFWLVFGIYIFMHRELKYIKSTYGALSSDKSCYGIIHYGDPIAV